MRLTSINMISPSLPILALLLYALVLTGCGPSVEERRHTAASTNDQAVLAEMASHDSDEGVRAVAIERLTDQQSLAKVALDARGESMRKAAIEKLSDQASLGKVALEARSTEVREAAINKLTDQATLYRVACEEKDLQIRTLAIGRMTDQPLLTKLATEQPAAAIRLAAVLRVTDNDFLLLRSVADSSNAVRMAAVEAMNKENYLARVAIESDFQALREVAALRVTDEALCRQINAAERQRVKDLAEIERQSNEEALAQSALQGKFDVIRLAAAKRLRLQAVLGKVASETRDREVCKIVFRKVWEQKVLLDIAGSARDNAVRTAASIKAEQTTWTEVFDKASKVGAGPVVLGEALAAVDLFPEQAGAKQAVVEACLNFIKRGDETRIPELVDMLGLYGDKSLAEDYLNCGQPDLDGAGREWGSNHGYNVRAGAGSHRAAWGSSKH